MSERLLDCPPQLGLQGPPPSSGPPKSLAPPRVRSEPRTSGHGWQANRRKTSTPTSTPEQCATPLAGQCKRRPVYVQSLWARKETLMDGSLAVLNSAFWIPGQARTPQIRSGMSGIGCPGPGESLDFMQAEVGDHFGHPARGSIPNSDFILSSEPHAQASQQPVILGAALSPPAFLKGLRDPGSSPPPK